MLFLPQRANVVAKAQSHRYDQGCLHGDKYLFGIAGRKSIFGLLVNSLDTTTALRISAIIQANSSLPRIQVRVYKIMCVD
jgi:hypothetical protein